MGDERRELFFRDLLPIEELSSSYVMLKKWYKYMSSLMSSEISALGECSLALITLVGFFASVCPHVYFESAGPHELVLADLTYIGPFSGMSPLVICQMPLCCKTHIAVCKVTFERLLTIMYSHVRE